MSSPCLLLGRGVSLPELAPSVLASYSQSGTGVVAFILSDFGLTCSCSTMDRPNPPLKSSEALPLPLDSEAYTRPSLIVASFAQLEILLEKESISPLNSGDGVISSINASISSAPMRSVREVHVERRWGRKVFDASLKTCKSVPWKRFPKHT